jgi:hypothetical protein
MSIVRQVAENQMFTRYDDLDSDVLSWGRRRSISNLGGGGELMKFGTKTIAMFAALAAMFLLAAPNAHATIELTLDDGAGHTALIIEGGAGDSCGVAGCLTNTTVNLGIWTITSSIVFTNHPGNPTVMDLGVTATSKKSKSGGSLTVTATDTFFSPASTVFTYAVGGTTGPIAAGFTHHAYGGNSNTPFDTSHLIGTFSSGSGASNTVITQNYSTVNPYSVTLQQIFTVGANGGTLSTDDNLSVASVPEPAVVTMLGGVLLCTIGAIRRRARRA